MVELGRPFQIFGSGDSVDLDVLFFVDELGTVQENLEYARVLSNQLDFQFSQEKKINANLAVLCDGVLCKVYKGSTDELNNALLRTYALHQQRHELFIKRNLPIDKALKMLRTMRKLLSFFTRTVHRSTVKHALKNGFPHQLEFLKRYDLTSICIDSQNERDIWKIVMFSIAQVVALESDIEIYTKDEVVAYFPELKPIMNREQVVHSEVIQLYLNKTVAVGERMMERGMSHYFEYDYVCP